MAPGMLLLFQQAEENKADLPWRSFLYVSRLHLIVASIRTPNLTSSGPPQVTGMERFPSSSSPVMDINPGQSACPGSDCSLLMDPITAPPLTVKVHTCSLGHLTGAVGAVTS